MMHPAVRETLARRLAALQNEVAAAERTARQSRADAQEDYETWQSLRDEKQAIQASLAAEDDTQPVATQDPGSETRSSTDSGASPAPRAQTYPEGETPPPADRAPTT